MAINSKFEIVRLQELMILRDRLMSKILYGLKEANRTADMELVEELELLVAEASLVSREISEILNGKENK